MGVNEEASKAAEQKELVACIPFTLYCYWYATQREKEENNMNYN